jgi:HEAT repeat protein
MKDAAATATPALCELIAGDDLWLAEGAVRAIAEIGTHAKSAVPALAKELERNRPRVAVQCARALANIGGPDADAAAPALVKAFVAGVHPLSTHAAIALATLTAEAAKAAVKPAAALLARTPRTAVEPTRTACEAIASCADASGAPRQALPRP